MEIGEKCAKEADNFASIYLHKQGSFLRAYNQSAMRFEREFFKYRVISKYIKKEKAQIYYLGFPVNGWEKVVSICSNKGFEIIQEENLYEIQVGENPAEEYEQWCKDVSMKNNYSLDPKADEAQKDEILKSIEKFPIAVKTPFEAFEFLNNIQCKIRLLEL